MPEKFATKGDVLSAIRSRQRKRLPLHTTAMKKSQLRLLEHGRKKFGSWREAVTAAGIDYDQVSLVLRWSKPQILTKLRELHAAGEFADLSALARDHSKLYGACLRHYGTGAKALKAAGIDYEELLGSHPYRWTRAQIIAELKRRHAEGKTLRRADILRKEPKLKRFCYAANHKFGNWSRALRAAGFRPDEIRNRDARWPREKVLAGIRQRFDRGQFLNTDFMLRDDLHLHAAGRRHFGSWEAAVEKAGIQYKNVRGGLYGWTRKRTQSGLRERMSERGFSAKQIRDQAPSLYRAAIHHFGSWAAALQAAKPEP